MSDAPIVIGIGPGFTAGIDVHMVIETKEGVGLGRVLTEGFSADESGEPLEEGYGQTQIYYADDAGVFTSEREVGEVVNKGDLLGKLGDEEIIAPLGGVIRGVLRSDMRVLPRTKLIEIDTFNSSKSCLEIRDAMRAIAGGALEAIMRGCNLED